MNSNADVDLPDDATTEEAAAIVSAIRAHLRALEAESDAADEPAWEGRRFRFAGRVENLQDRRIRIPEGTPTDEWTAASRTDRMPHR